NGFRSMLKRFVAPWVKRGTGTCSLSRPFLPRDCRTTHRPSSGREGTSLAPLYERLAYAYFLVATITLFAFSVILFVSAIVRTGLAIVRLEDPVNAVLDSIGLLIIGFAVVETSKFIAEEEIIRQRELRSALEPRRSLTKFITIAVIASSLEALVMIFKTSREDIPSAI